tara:strand:+ start:19 stop:141 length:123 start_codon:yes stop_codon:yes gene_type:complete
MHLLTVIRIDKVILVLDLLVLLQRMMVLEAAVAVLAVLDQ